MQIPGGLRFQIKEINFTAPPFQSFDSLVAIVLRVVLANPQHARKYRWPMDRAGVELWVDRTNALICHQNNWRDYVIEAQDLDPSKFMPPPVAHPAGAVAAGAKSLVEWFGAGMKPVDVELAARRAKVCEYCPLNDTTDMGNWFVKHVSELIRHNIGVFKKLNLSTPSDEKLGVCVACACPMKLKVHSPMEHVLNNMLPESKEALDPGCWILSEEKTSPAGGQK